MVIRTRPPFSSGQTRFAAPGDWQPRNLLETTLSGIAAPILKRGAVSLRLTTALTPPDFQPPNIAILATAQLPPGRSNPIWANTTVAVPPQWQPINLLCTTLKPTVSPPPGAFASGVTVSPPPPDWVASRNTVALTTAQLTPGRSNPAGEGTALAAPPQWQPPNLLGTTLKPTVTTAPSVPWTQWQGTAVPFTEAPTPPNATIVQAAPIVTARRPATVTVKRPVTTPDWQPLNLLTTTLGGVVVVPPGKSASGITAPSPPLEWVASRNTVALTTVAPVLPRRNNWDWTGTVIAVPPEFQPPNLLTIKPVGTKPPGQWTQWLGTVVPTTETPQPVNAAIVQAAPNISVKRSLAVTVGKRPIPPPDWQPPNLLATTLGVVTVPPPFRWVQFTGTVIPPPPLDFYPPNVTIRQLYIPPGVMEASSGYWESGDDWQPLNLLETTLGSAPVKPPVSSKDWGSTIVLRAPEFQPPNLTLKLPAPPPRLAGTDWPGTKIPPPPDWVASPNIVTVTPIPPQRGVQDWGFTQQTRAPEFQPPNTGLLLPLTVMPKRGVQDFGYTQVTRASDWLGPNLVASFKVPIHPAQLDWGLTVVSRAPEFQPPNLTLRLPVGVFPVGKQALSGQTSVLQPPEFSPPNVPVLTAPPVLPSGPLPGGNSYLLYEYNDAPQIRPRKRRRPSKWPRPPLEVKAPAPLVQKPKAIPAPAAPPSVKPALKPIPTPWIAEQPWMPPPRPPTVEDAGAKQARAKRAEEVRRAKQDEGDFAVLAEKIFNEERAAIAEIMAALAKIQR